MGVQSRVLTLLPSVQPGLASGNTGMVMSGINVTSLSSAVSTLSDKLPLVMMQLLYNYSNKESCYIDHCGIT